MSLFYFREIKPDDLDTLVALEARATAFPWSKTALLQSIEAGHTGYVCCENSSDAVVAYAIAVSVLDETSLLNICVGEEFKRQGVGRALLAHLIKQVEVAGVNRMLLEVRQSNTGAIYLYEALGFVCDGKRKGYYPKESGREDALLYSLSFGAGSSGEGG
jgi:ribosomal-protein-alanine N-acetyltransferase